MYTEYNVTLHTVVSPESLIPAITDQSRCLRMGVGDVNGNISAELYLVAK